MTPVERRDALVIGGGVAGLTAALALADAGLRVVVVEKEPRPGGRASSWRHAPSGDEVDIGPHVLTTAYRNFPAMLARLGTSAHVKWQGDTLLTFGNTRGRPRGSATGRSPRP